MFSLQKPYAETELGTWVDAYQALGVERTASAAEIKSAVRKHRLANHAAFGGDADTVDDQLRALVNRTNGARDVLENPERRREYDFALAMTTRPGQRSGQRRTSAPRPDPRPEPEEKPSKFDQARLETAQGLLAKLLEAHARVRVADTQLSEAQTAFATSRAADADAYRRVLADASPEYPIPLLELSKETTRLEGVATATRDEYLAAIRDRKHAEEAWDGFLDQHGKRMRKFTEHAEFMTSAIAQVTAEVDISGRSTTIYRNRRAAAEQINQKSDEAIATVRAELDPRRRQYQLAETAEILATLEPAVAAARRDSDKLRDATRWMDRNWDLTDQDRKVRRDAVAEQQHDLSKWQYAGMILISKLPAQDVDELELQLAAARQHIVGGQDLQRMRSEDDAHWTEQVTARYGGLHQRCGDAETLLNKRRSVAFEDDWAEVVTASASALDEVTNAREKYRSATRANLADAWLKLEAAKQIYDSTLDRCGDSIAALDQAAERQAEADRAALQLLPGTYQDLAQTFVDLERDHPDDTEQAVREQVFRRILDINDTFRKRSPETKHLNQASSSRKQQLANLREQWGTDRDADWSPRWRRATMAVTGAVRSIFTASGRRQRFGAGTVRGTDGIASRPSWGKTRPVDPGNDRRPGRRPAPGTHRRPTSTLKSG